MLCVRNRVSVYSCAMAEGAACCRWTVRTPNWLMRRALQTPAGEGGREAEREWDRSELQTDSGPGSGSGSGGADS